MPESKDSAIPRRPEASQSPGWERDLVVRLANAALVEQRRSRRWGILFKLLTFTYLFGILLFMIPLSVQSPHLGGSRHTALVDLSGVIADGEDAGADNIVAGLRAAFEDKNTAGVILRINSPGGSPVQSGYIYDEILRLRGEYPDTPFYAVVADICASGGMYVAAAADKIYANRASIIGSIGVRMDSFGFVGTMEKLGVERRLLTAGTNKGMLDPFLPQDAGEVSHMESLLAEVHAQFIAAVKKGRGDRLKDDERLFSGLIWTGEQALQLGLVDALGSAGQVAREVIGEKEIVDFTVQRTWVERVSERLGASLGGSLTEALFGPRLR